MPLIKSVFLLIMFTNLAHAEMGQIQNSAPTTTAVVSEQWVSERLLDLTSLLVSLERASNDKTDLEEIIKTIRMDLATASKAALDPGLSNEEATSRNQLVSRIKGSLKARTKQAKGAEKEIAEIKVYLQEHYDNFRLYQAIDVLSRDSEKLYKLLSWCEYNCEGEDEESTLKMRLLMNPEKKDVIRMAMHDYLNHHAASPMVLPEPNGIVVGLE